MPECIPIDRIVKILEQPAGAAERRNCEAHLASCPHCSTELALYRQFESGEPTASERRDVGAIVARLQKDSPAAPESWWSKIWNVRVLTPAAVALAAASVFLLLNPRSRVDRLEPVPTVMRSSQIAGLTPVGEVAVAPTELRWQPVAGAVHYQVRVLEVDRTELWHATVDSPSAELPDAVRARIIPLKKLLWESTATDAAGGLIATSGLQSFVLKK